MHPSETAEFGETEAELILKAGWRQGTAFQPPADVPVDASYDSKTEWLVVCTQSCGVVSPRLDVDPAIEVVVAKPVSKFQAKSPQATGKNLRSFHLPVAGIPGAEALQCDINRRFSIPRRWLLKIAPTANVKVSVGDARNLAGWLSRYYTRLALPNELVRRTRVSGLFEIIEKALKYKMADGQPLHHFSDGIYVHFEPDEELPPTDVYRLSLLFLFSSREAGDKFERQLADQLEPFAKTEGHGGISLQFDNGVTSETFVSQLSAYSRLSEWDYLSGLADVAEDIDKLPA